MLNFKISILATAVISGSLILTGCGGDYDNDFDSSTNTPTSPINPSQPTNPQDPVNPTQPVTPTTTNLFGKDIATGYAGTYPLSCSNYNLSSPITKNVVIDNNGKVSVDGEVLFENGILGVATFTPNETNNDSWSFTNLANNVYTQVAVTSSLEHGNTIGLITKNGTDTLYCDGSLNNPNHFTTNYTKILKERITKIYPMACIDLKDNSKFDTIFTMSNDNTVHLGNLTFAGSNFNANKFAITAGLNADTQKFFYDFSILDASETAGKGLKLGFDENEKLKTAILSTVNSDSMLTCQVK